MSDKPDASARKPLEARAVADYLLAHPDFFQEHRKLLTRLAIPHPAGGAVSLVERQVELLRQENHQLEQRLVDWMEIARENDRLLARLHVLAVAVLAAGERNARIAALDERLREDFEAAAVAIVLYGSGGDGEPAVVRRLDHDDPSLQGLAEVLSAGVPRCRALTEHWRERLFPGEGELASAAFVPLGAGGELGLLALASHDPAHFTPGLDTTYLARLGELAGAAVAEP